MQSIFEFSEYKIYLQALLSSRPKNGRGEKSRWAEALRCHTAYISQILNGNAHLSLEQAAQLSKYLGDQAAETHFFLLLVQNARAGTPMLREYFSAQIHEARQNSRVLKNRLTFQRALSIEEQVIYYSSWHFAAVHVSLSIPELQSKEALSRRLKLPIKKISEVVEFLLSTGLAVQKGDRLQIGENSIHLGADSPMVLKHHANWHMQAIAQLDRTQPEDLHYSSVVTLSRKDLPKIRATLVKAIEEVRTSVRESKEEITVCYMANLFALGEG
jgi:uncharacterized protein (TIGR02147 family)